MKSLSIIIVNWNGSEVILNCLRSIYDNLEDLDFEVIIVDNNSTDGSPELVEKQFPKVSLVRLENNYGFAKANNAGIEKCDGKYICLLNSDTEIINDSFKEIIDYMDNNDNIGILGPKLLYKDGSFQSSAGRFPGIKTELSGYFFLNRIPLLNKLFKDRFIHDEFKNIRDVDWICGACLFIRRSVIEKIGVFDELFFMYMEDVDYCLRVIRNNWKIVYFPLSKVVHLGGHSVNKADYKILLNNTSSFFKYYKKHFNNFSYILLSLIFISGTVFRIFLLSMFFMFSFRKTFKQKVVANIKVLKASFDIILNKNNII
ncbi:glycosyltransferase family 2 protein [candidate division KSB1 bacterium]